MKETYSKPMMDVEEFSSVEVLTVSYTNPSGIEDGDGNDD